MNRMRLVWVYWAVSLVTYAGSIVLAGMGSPLWPIVCAVAVGCLAHGSFHLGYHQGFYDCEAQAWDALGGEDDIDPTAIDWDDEWAELNEKDRDEWT